MAKISEIFSGADSKSRIFVILAAIVGIVAVIFIGSKMLGPSKSTGQAKVAGAPSLQSVPGGETTPEYSRALTRANQQNAKNAEMSGTSAIPTMMNVADQSMEPATASAGGNCAATCPGGEAPDVTDDLNGLVRDGKMASTDAAQLLSLAKSNVPVSQYASSLADMVKQGKVTPDQARKLLDEYTRQHSTASSAPSAQTMDAFIKSGKMSLDASNALLALQKSNASPADYQAALTKLVQDGKLSPAAAGQLMSLYNQQIAHDTAQENTAALQDMAKRGELTADVATELTGLQKNNVNAAEYQAELNHLVADGKMTPAVAAKLMSQYSAAHTTLAPASSLNDMITASDTQTASNLKALVASGKLSNEVASQLLSAQGQGASAQEYANTVDQLVHAGKLSPQVAAQLKNDYLKSQNFRNTAHNLIDLQANNAPVPVYKTELSHGVANQSLDPATANTLLQQYQTLSSPPPVAPTAGVNPAINSNVPGAQNFSVLQERFAAEQSNRGATSASASASAPAASTNGADQFAAEQAAAEEEAMKARQQRIQDLMSQMTGQAQSLVTSWAAPHMEAKSGNEEKRSSGASGLAQAQNNSKNGKEPALPEKAPIIKAGTIMFAVLTTAVNSDYPDTPVMATLVSGDFKGATLLGKLNLAQGQDRVSLSFTLMNRDEWPKTKSISAFAIDPDTARTVMASDVDHHYMLRYGTLFASSFMTGYANGISSSASTSSSGIFGTSSTHPSLSPGQELAIGLGQVGTAFGNALQSYVNTPATVKVNSGVGLGILFMADVSG